MTSHTSELQTIIDPAFENRGDLSPSSVAPELKEAILETINLLDSGEVRIAEKKAGEWQVNQWLKKAVLLSFAIRDNKIVSGDGTNYFDKVPSKFLEYDQARFTDEGFRVVPPAAVRKGAFIAPNVVLMPSYVNIWAYVDSGTMVDTWATVGSCAQIGKNVHLSGGVGIGGVLEPIQAGPVIIEDDCFIGARSEVAEGVIVEQGSVLSMGVFITASTKIVFRDTGEIITGRVPAYSVIVPGTLGGGQRSDGSVVPSLSCAVIIKQVDARTRSKTSINELLRD